MLTLRTILVIAAFCLFTVQAGTLAASLDNSKLSLTNRESCPQDGDHLCGFLKVEDKARPQRNLYSCETFQCNNVPAAWHYSVNGGCKCYFYE